MPTTREFTIRMEDTPGTLGKICRPLADRGVNILGFQSIPAEGKSLVRLVTDNPGLTKTTLETERVTFTEADVVQVKLPHRPGELARAVANASQATTVLDQIAASAKA